MIEKIFENYNPEHRYDFICCCNEYVESEGLFPSSMRNTKKLLCVLCDKYKLKESRVRRRNYENTRDIWVHPGIKHVLLTGADSKNLKYQTNLKSSYCRVCKCCHGKKGDNYDWVKAKLNGLVYEQRTFEEMKNASEKWNKLFSSFEQQLFSG